MHKQLCCAIQELSRAEEANNSAHDESGHFISHLTPKQRSKLVGLVRNKCTVNCIPNGKATEALWDTGAQVSIISGHFLDKTFPDLKVRETSELIEADLSLTAANGSPIKYTGWVQLDFKLSPEQDILHVPFLVTKEQFDLPVIGFNVIEQSIKSNNFEHDTLNSVFHKISIEKVEATVNFIRSTEEDDLGIAKTSARDYVIPKGESINIPCRVNHGPIEKRTPVLFEPDETQPWLTGLVIPEKLITVKQGKSSQIELEVRNTTRHNIVLPKRTVLGRVQLVQSVTPVEVKFTEWPKEKPVEHENEKLQAATPEIPATSEIPVSPSEKH